MANQINSTLPGADDILRCELENGIVILARSNFNSPSISLQGYLATGSILDPDDKLGLATFTASALMRGTQHRDFQAIYNELETVGASLGFSSGTISTSFGGKALVEDLGLLLDLLREVILEPVFPVEQLERLRAQQLTSLAIRAQDTASMASLAFDSLLFAGHPYSRPEDGYPETVAAVTRQDIVDFHLKNYGPLGMVITIVGAVEPQYAVDLVSQAFSTWQNPTQQPVLSLPPAPGLPGPARKHVPIEGKSQSDLLLGFIGPERRSADFMAASLGNNILGQFGMYGRIGESVRETAGLAYYAYSSLSSGIGPGVWYAGAGVEADDVDQTIEMILAEIRRFIREPVSALELEDTQANYIGRLPLGLEANVGVASALISLERYKLGLDYYRSYAGLVQAVTRQQILETAQKYLNLDQLVIATAG